MKIWRVPYPKFGDGPGSERVTGIAARLGVDVGAFGDAGVVIVGSNGKGSTAAMTAALLQQRAAPIGLFTSPHLFALNERFRIDGEDIEDEELQQHWQRVESAVRDVGVTDTLGGFEFLFLIAVDWFAARGCAHTVWEAGIGGRLDPASLVGAKRIALTSLDLEHTQLLGATLDEIARDKMGAAPAGATIFVSESCRPQISAIEGQAARQGARVEWASEGVLGALQAPLPGGHQRRNAALALTLARDILPLSDDAAAKGFRAARWPGRLEVLEADPLIVIDVGHTPDAICAALQGFEAMRAGRDAVLVCGASEDKDTNAMIMALAPSFRAIICAAARHKGAPAARIAAYAQAANPAAEIALAESVADARQLALTKERGGAVYVAGGLFLAAEFRAVHLGRDPGQLAFF